MALTRIERRDVLGRRIGYNWWREYNNALFRDANDVWLQRRESGEPAYNAPGAANSGAACYQLSDEEYAALYPRPTLKDCLVRNAGMGREPERRPVRQAA